MKIKDLFRFAIRNEAKEQKKIYQQPTRYFPVVQRAYDIGSWKTAVNAYFTGKMPAISLQDMYLNLVMSDAHLTSEMEKRRLAVTTCNVRVTLYGVEFPIDRLISQPKMQALLGEILDAKLYGWTILDFDEFKPVWKSLPRRNYIPHTGEYSHTGTSTGEDLTGYQNILLVDTFTPGVLATATFYSVLKRNAFSDFAQYAELYAMPVHDVVYEGNDPVVKQQIKEVLKDPSNVYAFEWPADVKINQRQGAYSSGTDVYRTLIDLCNAEISKVVVGQTMTTTDGSSYSQAKVHHQIYTAILAADRVFVESHLNTGFAKLLTEMYGLPEGLEFRLYEDESVDTQALLTQDKAAIELIQMAESAGLDTQWIYEKYGIPKTE